MQSLFNKILNIGIIKANSVKENKKIKLLNIFGFTWSIMIIVITLFDFVFGRELKESLLLHGISYVLIFIIFTLQKTGYYTLARVFFLSAIIGVTFVFANYTSPLNLVENFYFVYPLIALILIDKKWINISILVLCFLLYFIPNLYFKHYPKDTILPVLVFSVGVAAFVILNYSENLNKKHEKELLKSNGKLSEAYIELEERKNNELASMQLKALKAQMNPHFMFNAINSIQSLILKDNKQEAYNYLTLFSSLLRDNLKVSELNTVSFYEELTMIKKYLQLEALRFSGDFNYQLNNYTTIEDIKIPTMVIQPFIENAIRYGLLHKEEGEKNITIDFYQKEVFVCVIKDNGIGIEMSKKIHLSNTLKESKGTSIKAIQNRLKLLKEYYKTDIGIVYEDVEEGTKVVIKMPYIV